MINAWLLSIRVKTLSATVVPIVVGTCLAFSLQNEIKVSLLIFALLSALCIQIATNLFNDYIDFKKGSDTYSRIGPTRVSQSGLLAPKKVYYGAIFFCFLAVLFSIPLVFSGGWPIIVIGFISLFMAYLYTGGPFALSYIGLGDLFVIIFFGIVAVSGMYYLHTGSINFKSIFSGLQIGILCASLIAINNLRDIEQDRLAKKKTIPVRYGEKIAKLEIIFNLLAPLVLGVFWLQEGMYWAFLLPLLSLLLSISLCRNILKSSPSPIFNKFLAQSSLVHIVFGFFLSLGFLI